MRMGISTRSHPNPDPTPRGGIIPHGSVPGCAPRASRGAWELQAGDSPGSLRAQELRWCGGCACPWCWPCSSRPDGSWLPRTCSTCPGMGLGGAGLWGLLIPLHSCGWPSSPCSSAPIYFWMDPNSLLAPHIPCGEFQDFLGLVLPWHKVLWEPSVVNPKITLELQQDDPKLGAVPALVWEAGTGVEVLGSPEQDRGEWFGTGHWICWMPGKPRPGLTNLQKLKQELCVWFVGIT